MNKYFFGGTNNLHIYESYNRYVVLNMFLLSDLLQVVHCFWFGHISSHPCPCPLVVCSILNGHPVELGRIKLVLLGRSRSQLGKVTVR